MGWSSAKPEVNEKATHRQEAMRRNMVWESNTLVPRLKALKSFLNSLPRFRRFAAPPWPNLWSRLWRLVLGRCSRFRRLMNGDSRLAITGAESPRILNGLTVYPANNRHLD